MSISPTRIKSSCRAALAGLALASLAPPASAELVLAINNRTCGVLTVHLPGATECGPAAPGVDPPGLLEKSRAAPVRGAPGVDPPGLLEKSRAAPVRGAPGCYAEARNGFTTKIAVDQSYSDNLIRLTAEGECAGRNVKLAGECVVKIKRVTERVRVPGGALYELDTYVQAPATLVAVEITQGICDNQDGIRRCELTCRSRDQQ